MAYIFPPNMTGKALRDPQPGPVPQEGVVIFGGVESTVKAGFHDC